MPGLPTPWLARIATRPEALAAKLFGIRATDLLEGREAGAAKAYFDRLIQVGAGKTFGQGFVTDVFEGQGKGVRFHGKREPVFYFFSWLL